jgi:nucleoside-specific outer membrane channel protein Tsx
LAFENPKKKNHFYLEYGILEKINIYIYIYIYIAKKNCCGESLQPNPEMGQPAKIN